MILGNVFAKYNGELFTIDKIREKFKDNPSEAKKLDFYVEYIYEDGESELFKVDKET